MEQTPWWTNLLSILIALIVGAVLGRNLSAFAGVAPGGTDYFRDVFVYMPYSLMLFGILADMFTYEGVYTLPTLFSIASLALNGMFSMLWTGLAGIFEEFASASGLSASSAFPAPYQRGVAPTTGGAADGCDIPGFDMGFMKSDYTPQSLLVTATIFWYYILDLILNRGWTDATASIIMFGVLFAGQFMYMCLGTRSKGIHALFALLQGLIVGGTFYGIIATTAPARLPTSALPVGRRVDPSSLTLKDGKMIDGKGVPYVQVGGQWIPDISTPEGRVAAGIATAGATPASCRT